MTWTPVAPAGLLPQKSQTFNLTVGSGGDPLTDAGDMVYKWRVNGRIGAAGNIAAPVLTSVSNGVFTNWPTPGQAGSSFIFPFTPNDILLRSAEIILVPPAPTSPPPPYAWLMIGNAAWPDPVCFLEQGKLKAEKRFQDGGMFFPGWNNGFPNGYMDLHGSCQAGCVANVFVTFWYNEL
jgi:hypothetical protein